MSRLLAFERARALRRFARLPEAAGLYSKPQQHSAPERCKREARLIGQP